MQPSQSQPYRLLLVDDHRVFNDGLKSLLSNQPDLNVCGQVFTATDLLPAIQRLSPDLLLLDINLQNTNSLSIAQQILRDYPSVRIILLTMYNQPKLQQEAQLMGLHGYLLKEAPTDIVLQAIRTVRAGGVYFITATTPTVEAPFGDDFARRLNLTFREVEIIRLIREGFSTEQIALRLNRSAETIKKHRSNIYFKLDITKVTELIEFANRNQL
jgi:DNA-binding NarL/FixJ family response regulator